MVRMWAPAFSYAEARRSRYSHMSKCGNHRAVTVVLTYIIIIVLRLSSPLVKDMAIRLFHRGRKSVPSFLVSIGHGASGSIIV